MVMRSPYAGVALDPPLWIVPNNKALSLSLLWIVPNKALSRSLSLSATPPSVCGEVDRSVVMRSPCAGAALDP
jgi:hypothetical protein